MHNNNQNNIYTEPQINVLFQNLEFPLSDEKKNIIENQFNITNPHTHPWLNAKIIAYYNQSPEFFGKFLNKCMAMTKGNVRCRYPCNGNTFYCAIKSHKNKQYVDDIILL